ncbi:MAG TPA: excinuclease ABC subunit UvrA [Candidatus Absconditabacterales bacterium]|nr:excinuclease ABC subunit UvrA [Candidatus Absconditabacterales bacterium]HOQ78652.1 excinuclease ABC subunit UvrA [Candidatus Absconditabacterales bacterium]HPK27771.1 excinuclease ABC subunit UvrA [Candidatus Absconditabacterales bacterium]
MSKQKKIDMTQYSNEMVFQGVSTHNLKKIDLILPKNKVIVVTGVSGSGKSSFAFDTVYKEGQFRYIESLSSYLRQFFNLGTRPEIEHCSGLSPAIAIEQNKKAGNSRSTVGTLTEIDDYMRLLFAKLGDSYCYSCGKEIKPSSVEAIMNEIKKDYTNKRIFLLKEVGEIKAMDLLFKFVKKNRNKVEKGVGFTRYLLIGENKDPVEYFYLEDPNVPKDYFPLKVYGIYDRITVESSKIDRLKEDVIKILGETEKFGLYIDDVGNKKSGNNKTLPLIQRFTDKMYCPDCNVTYPEFTTQHFSPNRQEGACSECHGIGEILQVDLDKVIDQYSSYSSAILPWRDSTFGQIVLGKLAEKYSIDTDKLRKDLPERFQHVVIYGDEEVIRVQTGGKYSSVKYQGIESILKDQYVKGLLTVDFQAMLNMRSCPSCNGKKLRIESLNVFISLGKNKYNIADLQKFTLDHLLEFFQEYISKSKKSNLLVDRITQPLIDRLQTIQDLGLGYIDLSRTIDTLSGGEIQRLRLAKQLGNKLTGITYVLDEPTIGLSQREIDKTIKAIRNLQLMGNTVIVVEHNESFIKAADQVVEIGPGAGDFGGNIMFNGTYEDFLKSDTLTAKYLTGKLKVKANFNHRKGDKFISIKKASKHNLKNIDVKIRLGGFTVITGASGAGKTTLMYSTLYRFLNEKQKFIQSFIRLQLLKKGMSWEEIISAPIIQKELYDHYKNLALQEFYQDLAVDTIIGHQEIKNTIYVDQSNIGKTPRSCPATFIGTFDKIRTIFAGTTQAKYLGFSSSYFSFNSEKGACPACNGYGYKKVELQFLPDTYVPCDLCKGDRYKSEILEIKRKGKNIAEILNMYVSDALELFSEIDIIREELQLMCDIGLGYLRMGQAAHTLSGGESQRLKLVKHLLKSYTGHTVYFLDEPTVGLHPQDIEKLLKVLEKFLEAGDTILMIEHDKNIVQFADDIIELDDGKVVESPLSS